MAVSKGNDKKAMAKKEASMAKAKPMPKAVKKDQDRKDFKGKY